MAFTKYYSHNGMVIGESTNGVHTSYGPDAAGSVVATYAEGAPANTYLWTPYGTLAQKTGSNNDPKFGWNGSSGYRKTSLTYSDIYVRARHYDSFSGQWTSKDRFWPKQRAYSYVACTPVSYIDRSGLFAPPAILVEAGAGTATETSVGTIGTTGVGLAFAGAVLVYAGATVVGVALGYGIYTGLDAVSGGGYSKAFGVFFTESALPAATQRELQQQCIDVGLPNCSQYNTLPYADTTSNGLEMTEEEKAEAEQKIALDEACRNEFLNCNDTTTGLPGDIRGTWCWECLQNCLLNGFAVWQTSQCDYHYWQFKGGKWTKP